jgi:phosphocarrier protein FPr/phosphocarrier protein
MIEVASPFAGWLSGLEAVPDPVFAERMLGDGIAVDPIEGVLWAPVAGRVASIHAARHAVTIETEAGAVLLVHIGLETVSMGGETFVVEVAEGAWVAAGEPLIRFDLDAVGRAAASLVTPMILTNGEAFAIERIGGDRLVCAGEAVMRLVAREAAAGEASAVQAPAMERSLVVPLRHGIHARPAARIADLARQYHAQVALVASDGRSASARSPVALLALGLPHGAAVTLSASGSDAEAAVAALTELIAGGMGEAAPIEGTPTAEALPLPAELRGVPAVPGFSSGKAYALPEEITSIVRDAADPAAEQRALDTAIARVDERLAATSGHDAARAIAEAHRSLLSDPELADAAHRSIIEGRSAAFAWHAAIERFVGLLGAVRDARFNERVDDLRDIERSVIAALGGERDLVVPAGTILLAGDLLPSQLLALADAGLAGIVTARGGPTSHAAIIAAGIGIPMVVAAGDMIGRIADGTPLLLNAGAGTLVIDPPAEIVAASEREREHAARFLAAAKVRAHEPAMTRDGVRIKIFANLGSLADARAAMSAGAEGSGLLRTEFLFLDRDDAPGEEEQHATYQAIADALDGRPLIVRTLDIGADKPARYLPMAAEENPALGLRGLRLGLARPGLLETQLRALVRVDGAVSIMLPMVAEPSELAAAQAVLEEVALSVGRSPPPLGIMVETPAAALVADVLAKGAAFLSIGSNDLSQYALARDRGNPAVAAGLDALHPAVLRLIAMTVEGGTAHGRWIGVCGGLAADEAAIPLLIGLGITELSVPPAAVAVTKARVRALSIAGCQALAADALTLGDAAGVRARVAPFMAAQEQAI